ncbi:complement factor H like 3 [Xyrauchen texanus]|uniref:complement factor H like 3 n=1 Tax=Xyrauchen texanus TaxID=154827 RepID=UPI002242532A|nr:complement factor H like 3 [Xyrauchen texanus]XP_051980190.1 complement factor H like 3 [Xyrauchen texanus]
MRVTIKILGFAFFVFSLTIVRGQEKTCQLESNGHEIKLIKPTGKTIFKVGESVEITCSESHGLFFKKETYRFTCQKNGNWDYRPTCEEITCEVPLDKHVHIPNFYFQGDLKLGVQKTYYCMSGYRQREKMATCTRNGWKPDPLCAEITCEAPKIPNAQIVGIQKPYYTISSRLLFHCLPGFKPEQFVQITCDSSGQWLGIHHCTKGTCPEQELKNVDILFGYPGKTPPYQSGHVLVFQCTDGNIKMYGHRAIECQSDGSWDYPYPHCRGTFKCSKPTKHLRFVKLLNNKNEYNNFEILRYECNSPYNETSEGSLICQNGKWNGTFECTSKICPPPLYLEHGDFDVHRKEGEVITQVYYTCQPYYVLDKQQEYYKCQNKKWETPPKCLKPCEINKIVEMYNLLPPEQKVYVKHGGKYRLNCTSGWNTGGAERLEHLDVSCSAGNLQIDKSCDTANVN